MALRSGKQSTTAAKAPQPALGAVRRTQLITTYGVGSMIALENQSFVVSGLDSWKVGSTPDLREFRLQTALGVTGFHLPPAADKVSDSGVRVRRFPDYYSCPGKDPDTRVGCEENLRPFREFASPPKKSECASCGGDLTPSRFVVACELGHLSDFPYWRWVHQGKPMGADVEKHRLSIRTTGRTAALRSIVVSCSCGKESSMEGAFGVGAMASIKQECPGDKPWQGAGSRDVGCEAELRTLQRGSSAAWFAVVRSALSIPPFSQKLHDDIAVHLDLWKDEDDKLIARQAEKVGLVPTPYSAADVIQAVRDVEDYEAGQRPDPAVLTGFEASTQLRAEEFKQLSHATETEHFESAEPDADPSAALPEEIGQVMLIKRLREVRALQAFTRVRPFVQGDPKERLRSLSQAPLGWLPAIEVVGEGVFLRLDEEKLRRWEESTGAGSPQPRATRIRENHERVLAERSPGSGAESPVSARFVLLHTLAHTLIAEWSLEAGYPSSSLRERLYVSDEMAGLLIYTASSDSAGSLGGLVAQGEPVRLATTLQNALTRASWCSADPLCMESEASGTDSLNLAACHACVLLPETSCENNNTFLDRAMLVGTPDGATLAFFH